MQTGWVKDGINWYYMNGSGVMKTGWQKLADGNWYYFYEDGHMACNETVNIGGSNYTFNGSGIWVQKKNGWEQKDGAWYYYANGEKATGWKQLSDGNWYYFNSDGKMQTGWLKLGKYWYYLNGSGIMVTGWQKLADGNWYYFYPGGTMACNETLNINGVDYTFNASGIWVQDQTVKKNGWEQKDGAWYYYVNGAKATGWKQLPDGKWYYFNSDGKMQTGWLKLGKYWYYLNGSGIMVTGWQKLPDGNWYYFYGTMACNETVNIGGVDYTFNSSGIWVH